MPSYKISTIKAYYMIDCNLSCNAILCVYFFILEWLKMFSFQGTDFTECLRNFYYL